MALRRDSETEAELTCQERLAGTGLRVLYQEPDGGQEIVVSGTEGKK